MSDYSLYSMSEKDLEIFANRVKDQIADQLGLSQLDNHYVLVGKPTGWGKFKQAVFGKQEFKTDSVTLFVVKAVNGHGVAS